jgi:H+-translocating NAD(P) transhydrogenase subunit alpha
MYIGIIKEKRVGENRVALTPDIVKQLVKKNFTVSVENNAGINSFFSNENYVAAGAAVKNSSTEILSESDVVLSVNALQLSDISLLKENSVVISFLYAHTQPELLNALVQKKISAFAMDAVPRISRAQKMDALSSQANLAGYKAVIMGANELGKMFPLMMTAAGTIVPAKVLIFGAGVAGLQAIATAKRLGAVVEVTDLRFETKEQVESLGGKFITVDGMDKIVTQGGYTVEIPKEILDKQQLLIKEKIKDADLVITTALIMGKKAPVLVTEEMVTSMKRGAVIVDMAVEAGGNCSLSELNKTIVRNGVTIVGQSNLPSLLPVNASQLYAVNISTLLLHLATHESFKWEMDEEITKGCLITHKGELIHQNTKNMLQKN